MRVVITGASSGIGAATARILKDHGAHITAFDITDPGTNVDKWISVDLSNPEKISQAIECSTGSFDALLNIAGVPPRGTNAAKVLTINWLSVKTLTDQLLPRLNNGASIVNLASRAGAAWADNLAQINRLMEVQTAADLGDFVAAEKIDATRAYCLSKEALIVWTKLQTEQMAARNLRMNCISPSAVNTAILPDFVKALGDRATKTIERIGRPASPDDIAKIATFLAMPESGWLRGINLEADGGITAMVLADELNLGRFGGN